MREAFQALVVSRHVPEMILRIVMACLCGGVIGLERSKRLKEAGIRTHFIVSCAAAIFMLVSRYGFTGEDADTARVAAQVVSGISFLCAGVIVRNEGNVRGLTTAAGLWLTAAVGLSIGAGMYAVGIFSTVLIVLCQSLLHKITFGADAFYSSRLRVEVDPDYDPEALWSRLREQLDGTVENVSAEHKADTSVYECVVRTRNPIPEKVWKELLGEGVRSLSHSQHQRG